jgi:hypothetical protein
LRKIFKGASCKFLGIVENDRFPLQRITHKIERITRKSRKNGVIIFF